MSASSLAFQYVTAFVFGYLCGSVPFGVLITRVAGAPDVRGIGSGNIGATNVLRTGRKGLAAATLLGDMLKGAVAVFVTGHFLGRDPAIAAALGAFFGHLFPVWLKFKGGKGVATYIGLLLGFGLWIPLLAFCVTWAVVATVSRYSSLAALLASIAAPMAISLNGDAPELRLFMILSVLLWLMHHANISRLMSGTESKIGSH
ncbi:MAG TPA: glycerol-3-phosphate 1-O-acyltransferase PlsY [Xanthobacteraceae bacterium]